MFTRKPAHTTALDEVIEQIHASMKVIDPDTKEYASMMDQLLKAYSRKAEDKPPRVSPDTWAMIGANLGGILLIVGHERAAVVTSKALSFVRTLR